VGGCVCGGGYEYVFVDVCVGVCGLVCVYVGVCLSVGGCVCGGVYVYLCVHVWCLCVCVVCVCVGGGCV